MDVVCARCGASLSPDLAWCSQCYAPVRGVGPGGVTTPLARPAPEELPTWIRTQMRSSGPPPPPPVFSRVKAGPTSFGAFGRSLMSLLVVLGLVAGYPMARGGIFAAIGMDVPGTPFLIGYSVVAGAAAIYLFTRIWKRARVA